MQSIKSTKEQSTKISKSKLKTSTIQLPHWPLKAKVIFVALIGSPVVLLIGLIKHFAVNVPFYDQWEVVLLFKKSQNHLLGFADFFAQHNEHRILFPRIVMYVLARMTHWDVNYEIVVSVLLALLTFVLILLILRKTIKNNYLFAIGAVIISLIFFSPLQWENWLWGWQIQWFMNVFAVVLAVWALDVWETKSTRNKLIVAILASIIATYSLASGMFVWLICLPLFYFRKDLRRYSPYWIVAAIGTVGSHYIHYVNPAYHPSKTLFLHQPVRFIEYFLVYVVRPINFDFLLSGQFAVVLFIVSGGLSTYLLLKKRVELNGSLLPWLCFIGYGLIAAVTTDISRLGFGISQGYASRYVTLSNFSIIALVVLIIRTLEITKHTDILQRIVRGACVVLLSITTLLVMLNYVKGIEQMQFQHDHLVKARECALHATSVKDDCLLLLYPDKTVVWERLKYLRTIHYGGL